MLSSRYLFSFVVSTLVYGVAVAIFVGIFYSLKYKPTKEKNQSSVKIVINQERNLEPIIEKKSIIQNQPQAKEEQQLNKQLTNENIKPEIENIKETPKELPKITQVIEKIELKTSQKETIKDIQPTIKAQTQVKNEESQNQKNKEIERKTSQVVQPLPQVSPQKKVQTNIDNSDKKEKYLALIKQSINKHKYYPPKAARRGIEAQIDVKFLISKTGELISILSIDGDKLFHDSVREAINSAFPITPPTQVYGEDITLILSIGYTIQH